MKKSPDLTTHWHVYMIKCADQTLYTGITKDVSLRISQHNTGEGAKYTRGRRPVTLVYLEPAENHGAALRRENEIKQLGKIEKQQLAAGWIFQNQPKEKPR